MLIAKLTKTGKRLWDRSCNTENPQKPNDFWGLLYSPTETLHIHATIDLNDLTADVARHVGGKEGCHIGNVLNLTTTAQGNLVHSLRMSSDRAWVMAVSMKPGAIALARMPLGPIS